MVFGTNLSVVLRQQYIALHTTMKYDLTFFILSLYT